MSLLIRSAMRGAARSTRGARTYSSAEAGGDYFAKEAAAKAHAEATTDLWRKISYFVCMPALVVGSVYVWGLEKEHNEHLNHIIEHNGGVMPHAEYDYLHRRVKPFPWGMNVLFFNSRTNKNMETEE